MKFNSDIKNNKDDDECEKFEINQTTNNIHFQTVLNKYRRIIIILSILIASLLIFQIIFFLIKTQYEIKYFITKKFRQIFQKSESNERRNYTEIYNNISIFYNFSEINYKQTGVKKKIYVKYMDFWPNFKYENFDIHNILKERYEVILSDKPDYVIFSEFGLINKIRRDLADCVKLFVTIENTQPDFSKTDYAIGIHYIENEDRYWRKPTETHQLSAIKSVYNATKMKGKDIKKKKFCAWVASNGGSSVRNSFFEKLSLYKKVDSGGAFRNNIGMRVVNKLKFLSDYKFSLCFENSKADGYISEKLSDAFEAGTIPIYYGDDTVLELINNRSYIHVRDRKDFDEKIELIKKIDQNDTLYEEIIKEKIVIDDSRYPKEFQKYKNFIYHIFEQDKEKAKRFERKNSIV